MTPPIGRFLCVPALFLLAHSGSANNLAYDFSAPMADLQHQNVYTWGLQTPQLADKNITGAMLVFSGVDDWSAVSKNLHLNLLDSAQPIITTYTNISHIETALTKKVTIKRDNTGKIKSITTTPIIGSTTTTSSTQSMSGIRNTKQADFESGTALNGYGTVTAYIDGAGNNEDVDEVTDPNHLKQNTRIQTSDLPAATVTTKGESAHTFTQTKDSKTKLLETTETYTYTEVQTKITQIETYDVYSWGNSISLGPLSSLDPPKGKSFTYYFTKDQLKALDEFIKNGNDFGISFDPDCHFNNNGISLVVNIPDHAITFLLLGTSFFGLEICRRKQRQNTV